MKLNLYSCNVFLVVLLVCSSSVQAVKLESSAGLESAIQASLEESQSLECFCSRDYKPVCAVLPTAGAEHLERTFDNACLANCVGGSVIISEGECGVTKPTGSECFCNRDFNPVCAALPTLGAEHAEKTFNNACEAECASAVVISRGKCNKKPVEEGCSCPRILQPVCAVLPTLGAVHLEKTFNNACEANCVGGAVIVSQGKCASKKEKCDYKCPANSSPKPNRKCMDTFADCKCEPGFYKKGNACVKKEFSPVCSCTREYVPVCATVYDFGGRPSRETFSNKCLAQCEGGFLITDGKCSENSCNYKCPANSSPKPNRKCMDSHEDCECNSGFSKKGSKCVSDGGNDKCNFQCPKKSYRKKNRSCYDNFADCECEEGYAKKSNKCFKKRKLRGN